MSEFVILARHEMTRNFTSSDLLQLSAESGQLKCLVCQQNVGHVLHISKDERLDHARNFHGDIVKTLWTYSCSKCQKPFPNLDVLQDHEQICCTVGKK